MKTDNYANRSYPKRSQRLLRRVGIGHHAHPNHYDKDRPLLVSRSHSSFAVVSALFSGLLLVGCSNSPTTPKAPTAAPRAMVADDDPLVGADDRASRTELQLMVEALPELYFEIRAQAAGVVAPDPLFSEAAAAWQPVHAEIGTFGGFWRFDLAGLLSRSPAEFRQWMEAHPESVTGPRGGTIPVRGPGLAMADAMEELWPHFQRAIWPERRSSILELRARLDREFMPKHQRALTYMLESLGIEDPNVAVPVYLVSNTQPPGATTYRSRSGPVAAVSLSASLLNGAFSDLEEIILHETCHALDGASRGENDVFTRLRSMLEERGVEPRHELMGDVPHMVMFVQAEETMRRIYDADHVAYGSSTRGDIAPLYQRNGLAAEVVRKYWRSFLDGERTREETLRVMVNEVLAKP